MWGYKAYFQPLHFVVIVNIALLSQHVNCIVTGLEVDTFRQKHC